MTAATLVLSSGLTWEDHWTFVTQTGAQTGNDELQDYSPEQVQVQSNNSLDLVLEKKGSRATPMYKSGKIKSKRSLTDLAPEHGAMEIEFRLPANTVGGRFWLSSHPDLVPGLWPAIWLLPDGGSDIPWPTGGEIDLMEMMHFRDQPRGAQTAFSTMHFGPSRGVDAVYDGHWGLRLASYPWNLSKPEQTIRFEWEKLKNEGGRWRFTQFVNGAQVWTQKTDRTGHFRDFEKGKNFQRASPSDFAPGSKGDPARIFQAAFDDPRRGMHVIVNLAFGGTPWGHDKNVDLRLQKSVMRVVRYQVWNLAA